MSIRKNSRKHTKHTMSANIFLFYNRFWWNSSHVRISLLRVNQNQEQGQGQGKENNHRHHQQTSRPLIKKRDKNNRSLRRNGRLNQIHN